MPLLSLTGKRWNIPEESPTEDILPLLLHRRGWQNMEELHASPADPCSFPDDAFPELPKAIERIQRAVQNNETIAIFGDYDCDGVTSTALLVRAFHRRGIEPIVRLPHRVRDGYGLKDDHVIDVQSAGTTLLITVDTGIGALGPIERASALGIDVIVVDHHHLADRLPSAYAIIHPCRAEQFPAPPPAAAGITWHLVQAWEKADGHGQWEDDETDLALACIGTVADLVELKGMNRRIVQRGLLAFSRLRSGALADLRDRTGIIGTPSSRDIGFRIAPRLNAAGRMADPEIALQALLGETQALNMLDELNRERQQQLAIAVAHAREELDSTPSFLSIASGAYAPGIVGLIASRLTESFGKPSLVAHINGEFCTASLRSIPGFHVTQALERCRDLLMSFGGHAQAAGCTFQRSVLPELQRRLAEDVLLHTHLKDLYPALSLDAVLQPSMITLPLCEKLHLLEPFGQGNPEPRFLLTNQILSGLRRVGNDQKHLQGFVGPVKCIGFDLGYLQPELPDTVDIVVRLGIDQWQGRMSPQLFIDDIRIAQLAPMVSLGR